MYYDGQFDDARLLINLAATAVEQGAVALNYTPATALTRDADGFVDGIVARDLESGQRVSRAGARRHQRRRTSERSRASARASGRRAAHRAQPGHPPRVRWVVSSRRAPRSWSRTRPTAASCSQSRGTATRVVGTTDTPITDVTLEPRPFDDEIEFILETAGRYLRRPITRADVLSVFVGIRPLVRSGSGGNTASLSRDHTIHIDPSGLLTIAGGKWTTYRHMAEDCVDHAATLARLPEKPCVTRNLNVHGFHRQAQQLRRVVGLRVRCAADSGSHPRRAVARDAAPSGASILRCRSRVGRARRDGAHGRGRAGAADARALSQRAGGHGAWRPETARLLARELGRDDAWQAQQVAAFRALAEGYVVRAEA